MSRSTIAYQAQPRRLALTCNDAAAADFFIRPAGRVVAERRRLTDQGRWEALRREPTAFVHGRAETGEQEIRLALDYLLATARRVPAPAR